MSLKYEIQLQVGQSHMVDGGKSAVKLLLPSEGSLGQQIDVFILKATYGVEIRGRVFVNPVKLTCFHNGKVWTVYMSRQTDESAGVSLVAGGNTDSGRTDVIEKVTLTSLSNATLFGTLLEPEQASATMSDGVVAIFGLGYSEGAASVSLSRLQSINFAHEGQAAFYMELDEQRYSAASPSDKVRAYIAAGQTYSPMDAQTNTIKRFTYATKSDLANVGNLSQVINGAQQAGVSSKVRSFITGGYHSPITNPVNNIESWISAIGGNSTQWGDLTIPKRYCPNVTSETRSVVMGGSTLSNGFSNVIDYFDMTIQSNAVDFGDLVHVTLSGGACTNKIKGAIAGGSDGSRVNTLQYVNIAETSNAMEFGDKVIAAYPTSGASQSHGGL